MPTMRHPNVPDPYEAVSEAQASMLRMSGWVTETENPELFAAAAEREQAEREQAEREQAEADAKAAQETSADKSGTEPVASGEQKTTRARRASSDKESS